MPNNGQRLNHAGLHRRVGVDRSRSLSRTMSSSITPAQQTLELTRGCVNIIALDELEAKLAQGRPLRIKAGFDRTAPDLHLDHTVLLQVMRRFQRFGHQVVFLVGDFTAMIGDPSGSSQTRPTLSKDEVRENADIYARQVFTVLDPGQTQVRFNSEWLGKLSFLAALEQLASRFTIAQLLQRDDFAERFRQHRPIGMHELFYPLTQDPSHVVEGIADVVLQVGRRKFCRVVLAHPTAG